MIRFRWAMKPTVFVMKYYSSLPKGLVSLPIWNESYSKCKLFGLKMDHSISERATSCLFRNRTLQIFFYQCTIKTTNVSYICIYNTHCTNLECTQFWIICKVWCLQIMTIARKSGKIVTVKQLNFKYVITSNVYKTALTATSLLFI